jgi:hypothetical protein
MGGYHSVTWSFLTVTAGKGKGVFFGPVSSLARTYCFCGSGSGIVYLIGSLNNLLHGKHPWGVYTLYFGRLLVEIAWKFRYCHE